MRENLKIVVEGKQQKCGGGGGGGGGKTIEMWRWWWWWCWRRQNNRNVAVVVVEEGKQQKGGGGGKTMEMWRWWWRENNRSVGDSLLLPLFSYCVNGSNRLSPTPSVSNLRLRPCHYLSTVTRSPGRASVDGFRRERLQRFATFDSFSVQRSLETR